MLRVVGAGVLVVMIALGAAPAAAQAKRKVEITTDPPGAQVYLNLKEDGPVCTTPCTVSVPIGSTPVIIELPNYQTLIESITVAKKDKKPKVSFKLDPASGVILIKGPRGAEIRVNDIDRGTAPARIEIEPGDHVVVITLDGKQLLSEAVQVENGGEVTLEAPRFVAGGGDGTDGGDGGDGGGGDGLGGGDGPEIEKSVPKPRKPRAGPIVIASLGVDIGFRKFRYEEASGDLAPEDEAGQVLAGPIVEFFPGTLAGIRALRGLALLGRYGHGVNSQELQDANGNPLNASTFWRSFEVSLRQRWFLGDTATVEVGAGYVQDAHRFSGSLMVIQNLPDAEYGAVRIGGRASLRLASLEPYIAGENRIVLSGGELGDRFATSDVTGLRGAVGAVLHLGALTMRFEGSIARYSWAFKPAVGAMFQATGATDTITKLSASVGYSY